MSHRSVLSTFLLLILLPNIVAGEVTLPAVFSDHMVLQRDKQIRVWGWADAGEKVTVSLADASMSATADADGRWQINLPPLKAGGPFKLTAKGAGESDKVVEDVLVGEVWLCSGQSNMAMTVARSQNVKEETSAADLPLIRMFKETSGPNSAAQDQCHGSWQICSPASVPGFSATAFFFGKELHRELKVPIGLINSSVGGTSVESWTSPEAQSRVSEIGPRLLEWKRQDEAYDAEIAKQDHEESLKRWEKRKQQAIAAGKATPRKPSRAARPKSDRNYPGNLYNGKIHGLVGYTIRGAVWYQGENSSGRGFAHLYQAQLTTLMRDWRARWGQGDFPFAWVQLPNFHAPQTQPSETTGWVLVREGMLRSLSEPNTGMAITTDIGMEKNIHPTNKQDVGKRLAYWALSAVYDRDGLPMGPIFSAAKFHDGKAVLQFEHAHGLRSPSRKLEGFAVAGEDRKFHWGTAKIDGNSVVVSSSDVARPVAIRYAWADNPRGDLQNERGIPASPFRTDNWDEAAKK